jgi:hypothetical protein
MDGRGTRIRLNEERVDEAACVAATGMPGGRVWGVIAWAEPALRRSAGYGCATRGAAVAIGTADERSGRVEDGKILCGNGMGGWAMSDHDSDSFGHCSFREAETVAMVAPGDKTREFAVRRAVGQWHPPARLADFLPPQFSLPLECYTGSDGLRRVLPACNFEALIDLGAVGGLAVIHGLRGFDEHADHSYKAMQLIHQYVRGRLYQGTRGMQEHFARNFIHSRDLFLRRSGRSADSSRDVLPDDLGISANGDGRNWSVTALTKIGREAAREAGHVNPVSWQAISFGLYEAARRNPLDVPADEVRPLVRFALFDLNAHDRISSDLLEHVQERLLAAIHEHLEDALDEFCRWFAGPHNTLIKQIAKQKKRPGGPLQQADVRRALLHLGWQAYGYVGQCVHALMRTVKNSLPDLNEHERRLFEHMHESQDYYGGLPAALLAERMPFLHRGVLAIWNDPDNPAHVAVLHRLLRYYVQMACSRRLADRQIKKSSTALRESIDDAVGDDSLDASDRRIQSDEEDTARPESPGRHELRLHHENFAQATGQHLYTEVAEHLRELNKIECPARCLHWEYRLASGSADIVTIDVCCECQGVSTTIKLSHESFADEVHRILDP